MRYDKTTKQLVLKKLQTGVGICKIAKDFGIDRGTIRIWKKMYESGLVAGNIEFDLYFEVKIADRTGTRIYDYEAIKNFIDTNPDCTQSEIVREFKCSKGLVWKVLKFYKYTRKKNDFLIKSKIQ
jgi:DNA invertase Pin-like site-specific DNA recombinase